MKYVSQKKEQIDKLTEIIINLKIVLKIGGRH